MLQQLIALIVIIFFLARLFWQKKNNRISRGEFVFWLVFWFVSGLAILFIRDIDRLVRGLGFSGSGIEILLYLSVAILFYLIFRLRLKLERIETDITKIISEIAIKSNK